MDYSNQIDQQSVVNDSSVSSNFNMVSKEYASFGKRFLAYLIDTLILILVAIVIFLVFMMLSLAIVALGLDDKISFLKSLINSLQFILPYFIILFGQPVYCFIAERSSKHKTIGKKVMKIVVKEENGDYLNTGNALLRFLLKVLLNNTLLLISFITMLVTEKKQTLYDMILKHEVVVE